MSLSGYDLRKRGGPRRRLALRARWRRPTRRELRLAAFVVYVLVLGWAVFLAPQREITRQLSAWLDRPPKVERCDSSVRAQEGPRGRCVRW